MTVINRGVASDDTPGSRLRRERLNKNISINEFASICGVTPTCIIYIEGNKSKASLTNLRKFAHILNVPIPYLGCYEDLPVKTKGERLIKARLFHGLTKIQLANQLGVDVKVIRGWETDKGTPGLQYSDKLGILLNILEM
jgi:transcriptional regulator with XRE-family HTH domain